MIEKKDMYEASDIISNYEQSFGLRPLFLTPTYAHQVIFTPINRCEMLDFVGF